MNKEKMPSVLRCLFIFVQIGSYNACATKMTKKVEHYSVSGHGFENPNVSFILPKEVTIHFYVKHGEILPVSDAGQMWDSLAKNQAKTYEEIGYSPVETFQNGSKCLNGWLEYTTDFPSGMWKHEWPNPETENFVQNYEGWNGAFIHSEYPYQGAYLSDIVAQLQEKLPNEEFHLHWISCRKIDDGAWWNIVPKHP